MVAAKERPILFNTESILAILNGQKTETRRVIKPQPSHDTRRVVAYPAGLGKKLWGEVWPNERWLELTNIKCPYGDPDDLLWVRETWQLRKPWAAWDAIYPEDLDEWTGPIPKEPPKSRDRFPWSVDYRATFEGDEDGLTWRPSIHMPKWASRIKLRVVDRWPERLSDITDDGAVAEGVDRTNGGAIQRFRERWNRINTKRGFPWYVNPWVWVVRFQVEEN